MFILPRQTFEIYKGDRIQCIITINIPLVPYSRSQLGIEQLQACTC